MSKMIILQGTPCSGKSTWARDTVTGRTDIVIISRDDIRHSLGDYMIFHRENLVDDIETAMINLSLARKYDVIVDSVNLDPGRVKQLEQLANDADALVEKKQLYCDFWVAVERDSRSDRPHHLGESKIKEFYNKYYPEQLAKELDENPTAPVIKEPVTRITLPDGTTFPVLTAQNLNDIKKLARLKYAIGPIARMLNIPVEGFRLLMADKDGEAYKAYDAGKLQSTISVRNRVITAAERGEDWAISIMEGWQKEQLAEEYGCHM